MAINPLTGQDEHALMGYDPDTNTFRPTTARSSWSHYPGDPSQAESELQAGGMAASSDYEAAMNSPAMKSYRDALRAAVMQSPGSAAYKQGDYYKSLQSDVTEEMRQRGWAAGNADASRGVMSPGSYGTGMRGATEQTEMEGRLRLAASGQAQQAWAQEQAQYIDGLLRAAGFEKGIADTKFQHWYMQEALKLGISQAEAQATLQKWQMALDVAGHLGAIAGTVATGSPGPAMMPNTGRFNPAGGPPTAPYMGRPY